MNYFKKGLDLHIKNGSHFVANSTYTEATLREYSSSEIEISVIKCLPMLDWQFKCESCDGCKFLTCIEMNKFDLMVGTIEPRKNYDFALNIYGGLDRHLVIVGRYGWQMNKFAEHVSKLDNVTWLQKVCDGALKELYKKAEIYISTSIDEGFNIPALECQQFNLDSVLSDIPVNLELNPRATLLPLGEIDLWREYLCNSTYKKYVEYGLGNIKMEFEKAAINLIKKFGY